MPMLKTVQVIVNHMDGKLIIHYGIVSVFILCIYYLFKNYKFRKF